MNDLRGPSLRTFFAYAAMIVAAIGIFWVISRVGAPLEAVAPAPAVDAAQFGVKPDQHRIDFLQHVLLALAVIIIAARVVGQAFRFLGQPPVIGEVCAGIMLGPSLLGWLWPEGQTFLFPESVHPFIQVLAQVGAILYMFMVGLEMDTRPLKRDTQTTVAIAHASIVAPFLLGALLALWVYPRLSSSDVPFTVFALFLGVSLSVTAFPVLARILTDRGIQRSHLGALALICAAVGDVTAWCLLAFVVGVARTQVQDAVLTIAMALAFVAIMFALARPLFVAAAARVDQRGTLTQGTIALVIVALLVSALTTESIGIHAVFGAFLLGAIIPHDSLISRALRKSLEDLVIVLLLPAFFAYTGLRTQIGLVSGAEEWIICLVIIVVACLGKFGGSTVAGRLTGLDWREASALGILMNTRGLMELIVLNIGLDLKVISPKLFAMLVIMAVVTTIMTSPILSWLTRGREMIEPNAEGLGVRD